MKWGPCKVAVEVSKEKLYMQRAHSGKNRWPRRGSGAREMAESDDMGSWHFILDGVWPRKPCSSRSLVWLGGCGHQEEVCLAAQLSQRP